MRMNVHPEHGLDVVVARLPVGADDIRASLAVLSVWEQHRARRYAFDRDRRRYITRRAHLRKLIGERLERSPRSVEFSTGPNGKPSLIQPATVRPLRFNVSHSDDLTMYGFSTTGEIGIDVEAIRPVDEADCLAVLAFSPREQTMYRCLPAGIRPLAFLSAWTRKEAFVKAIGSGLNHPLRACEVALADEPARIVRSRGVDGRCRSWHMQTLVPAAGFIATLVREMPS